MKLYYSKGACSLAVRIIINEIGLPCEYVAVNLKTKKMENDGDYLSVNPKGSVPALEIKPNEVLTENSVIQQYLADTNHATNLLPGINDFKRYRVLELLNFITTELHKNFGPLFNPKIPAEINNDIFIPILKAKFKYLNNNHLANKKYLMGNEFTLPDAYLFVVLFWSEKMKIDLSDNKELMNYFALLKQRKSIEQSLAQEGLVV